MAAAGRGAAAAVAAVWFARTRTAEPPPSSLRATAFDGETMGTTYRVLLARVVSEAHRATLQRGVDSLLRDVNARMSTYDTTSELSRFNTRRDTLPSPISSPLAFVLRTSASVHAASGGRFDVTVGPLVNAWGFGPAARPQDTLADSMIVRLRQHVGMQWLVLRDDANGPTLRKRDPRVRVDLSAVAKGYGVDVVSDWLAAQGEAAHLVEIGGEMRARGRNAARGTVPRGIEDADPDARRVRFASASKTRAGQFRELPQLVRAERTALRTHHRSGARSPGAPRAAGGQRAPPALRGRRRLGHRAHGGRSRLGVGPRAARAAGGGLAHRGAIGRG
jgi:thiamine biosynthesis lipoprotein ApbE